MPANLFFLPPAGRRDFDVQPQILPQQSCRPPSFNPALHAHTLIHKFTLTLQRRHHRRLEMTMIAETLICNMPFAGNEFNGLFGFYRTQPTCAEYVVQFRSFTSGHDVIWQAARKNSVFLNILNVAGHL